jgi:hypothetical protein
VHDPAHPNGAANPATKMVEFQHLPEILRFHYLGGTQNEHRNSPDMFDNARFRWRAGLAR